MSEDKKFINRKHRKSFEKSYERAQKQHARQREDIKKHDKEVLGPVQKQMDEEIARGGTDFSLYNLVLSIADFSQCATALDSCRKVYESLFPTIRVMNLRIKTLMAIADKYELSEADRKIIQELKDSPNLDPMAHAKGLLEQGKERARQRSKLGIKFYGGEVKL